MSVLNTSLFCLAVSHFQLPVTAYSDSTPDLYLCLHQSAGSEPTGQEQDRVRSDTIRDTFPVDPSNTHLFLSNCNVTKSVVLRLL